MQRAEQNERAGQFRALHQTAKILLLPNIWDVVSARLFEVEGFAAVGTTSAGIASTLGFPDGQRIGVEATVSVVERTARALSIPISADIEAGYEDSPDGVAETARVVLRAGAVGINLEDSLSGCGIDHYAKLFDVAKQCERIRAIRRMAESEGVDLFINARTDVYLLGQDRPEQCLEESILRGNAYLEAGADGVFVPDMGTLDRNAIATLAREVEGPLNVIAGEATPSMSELEDLGVARVSVGPRPMRAALALLRAIAREWKETGTTSPMCADALSYEEVNGWFE